MKSMRPSSNWLLRALPTGELEALAPRLQYVELVRDTVLVEALTRVCLPRSGVISMLVRISEGQTVQVATIGPDSVFGAVAARRRDIDDVGSGGTARCGLHA